MLSYEAFKALKIKFNDIYDEKNCLFQN